ncbi:MAG: hypothetical protein KDC87_19660 [Planctomycetes bacterium]|nr:hypothetical protein [Planctomycetota bacterium]MCB9871554.1 hypothetical protein [Planctomycetota bacterium]MCB9889453.1 hypothetical protein [Planctomycetota bacterium]
MARHDALVLGVLLAFPGGCGIKAAVDDTVEKAVQLIDNGIKDVLADSSNWRTTLQRVADQLPKDVSEVIRTDAQNLATRSIAQAGTEFRCNVDFLAQRAAAALRRLKARLLKQNPPPLPPGFCHVVPSSIDLKVRPASWSNVTIHGYDLDHLDRRGKRIAFAMLDARGGRHAIPEERIGRTTHYQVTLNLGAMARELHTRGIRKIVTQFDGATGTLPEIVVTPWEPTTKPDSVTLAATDYMPPRVGKGDRDFKTKNDKHMSVDTRAEIRLVGGRVIESRVFLRCREERKDWTEVSGWSPWAKAYEAPGGWSIVEVRPRANSRHTANITSKGRHQYDRPAGEVVARFEVWGDHDGDEAGTWTHVRVSWRPMQVLLKATAPDWLR